MGSIVQQRRCVCIYAASSIAQKVTLLSKSGSAERVWCMLHTNHGPSLLGAWHRPPNPEATSIESCEREHDDLATQVLIRQFAHGRPQRASYRLVQSLARYVRMWEAPTSSSLCHGLETTCSGTKEGKILVRFGIVRYFWCQCNFSTQNSSS